MKATDLMVGCWVSYKEHPYKVKAIGLFETGILGWNPNYWDKELDKSKGCILLECLNPIPLTEEILRANNIPHQQSLLHGVEWVRNLGDKGFEITLDTHDFAINANIKYVHQLQHALRLVGLDEVADNFKIK